MFRKLFMATAALLGAAAAPLSAHSVKAGIDAWQRSDYANAVAIWRPLAEKGDAQTGKYKWKLAEGKLTFKKVADKGEGREKALTGATWNLEKGKK